MPINASTLTNLLKTGLAQDVGLSLRDLFFVADSWEPIVPLVSAITDQNKIFEAVYGQPAEDYWWEALQRNKDFAPWFASMKDIGVVPKNFGNLSESISGITAYQTTLGDYTLTAAVRNRGTDEVVFCVSYRGSLAAVVANYDCSSTHWHYQVKDLQALAGSDSVWVVTDPDGVVSAFDNDPDFKAAVLGLPSYSIQVAKTNTLNQILQETA